MEGSPDSLGERMEVAAGNLRVDVATAEVMRAMEAAGVESRLLKGPTIGRWLYPPESPRPYADCDLLVAPADVGRAETALAGLGFTKHVDSAGLPDWWREHAASWWREQDGVPVDVHRTLPGVTVDDDAAWATLSAQPDTTAVAGFDAPSLPAPARALHVALHAAHHGVGWWQPMQDLERALAQVDLPTWEAAASLARRLGATDTFAVGLRLSDDGRALAARLGLPAGRSAEATLRASTPPPVALGFEQLAGASGTRERVGILWHKVVPPPGFMRHWHPMARRGTRGLLLAYLYRPVWLLRRSPEAFRAWRDARRRAREG